MKVNVWLVLLLLGSPTAAQMIRTAEADAATQTKTPVLEIILCEDDKAPENFKVTVYDYRVLPRQRVLPRYILMGMGREKGRLSRENEPCPGGNGTALFTSEFLEVEPAPAPAMVDGTHLHQWVLELKLSGGGFINPMSLFREHAPSRTTILYHPETGKYCIQGWEEDCKLSEDESEPDEEEGQDQEANTSAGGGT